jgi:pimeloyl-ACP methyl ester carboxylesterase
MLPRVTTAPHRYRRLLWRVARIVILVYAGLGLAAYLAQDWLMYPAARRRGEPPRPFRLGPGSERVDMTATDGTPIAAVFGRAVRRDGSPDPDAASRPSVLYFYGNGGSVQWSDYEFDHFRRLGANVMIPDLPGYGASGGTPTEPHCYAAADAAYDALCRRVDPHRIIVVGWSLGGGMAVDLASRRPVAALATFNAFTSMPDMAQRLLPFLPARYLCRDQYANEAKIRTVRCPTLICNGLMDVQIPGSMSDRLAAAAAGPVTRLRVATADHNSIFDAEPHVVWPALQRLVDDVANK